MQIGNQRSKLRSSLISTKRAQLLTSPFPLGCDHPTSLGFQCAGGLHHHPYWPLWCLELALGRRVQPGLRLHVCTFLPSVPICQGQIRVGGGTGARSIVVGSVARVKEKRKRWKPGWAGHCGSFRAYVVTSGTGRDAGRLLLLLLLRVLAWFSPCLAAPGGSGQSPWSQGNQCWGVWQGGRHQSLGEGRAGCLGCKFCSFVVFLPTPSHPGAGGAQGPSSYSHPASSRVVLRSGSRLRGFPPTFLPQPSCLQQLHMWSPQQPHES